METIFKNSGIGQSGYDNGYQNLDAYGRRIRELIDDSVNYEQSYLSPVREQNTAYYRGEEPSLTGSSEEDEETTVNKSTFVSTDVRDTILTVMPSLMRIFTNFDERIATFTPNSEGQEEMAEQAYDYINYVFHEDNPGFLILHSVIKDALTVKVGITKWWTDTDYEVREDVFQNITNEQLQYIIYESPDCEIVEMESREDGIIDSVRVRFVTNKPLVKVDAVPPEEFRISSNAKSINTADLVGHERLVSISELVSKGYDYDEIRDAAGESVSFSTEKYLRNPGSVMGINNEYVLFGEWYIRIDGDGDGVSELRYICTVGSNYRIVNDETSSRVRFALWNGDPIPHTAIGDCLADITKDIQRIKTNMMRGQLDSLAESINPRTVVNELVTNIEDVLNDEVGAVIRTRGDPANSVSFVKTPYYGDSVQVTVDYLDKVRASRTGITEASKGLDPKAMQSTAMVGIDAIVSGAQERIELIARVLAETGFKDTIKGLLHEVTNNPNPERVIRLRGKWHPVNPSAFDATMRVQVNPTIGKGTDMVRIQALSDVKNTQLMIIEKFGIDNPVVSPVEFRNTVVDILTIANIRNHSRYFKDITPETMEAIKNTPKEPDPAAVLAQAELEKVKKDVIVSTGEFDLKKSAQQLEAKRHSDEMDFKRDKLNIESSIRIAELATQPTSIPSFVDNANQGVE